MDNKEEKLKLHTSFKKRQKQHRNTIRQTGWGKGVVYEAVFSKKLLRLNYIPTFLTIALLYILVTILPYSCLKRLGAFIGKLMGRFMKTRAYVLERNIELAFPNLSSEQKIKLKQDIFKNSGIALFETGIAWFWSDKRFLKLIHADENELQKARELAQNNTRTLVLTCHFVHLEIMARAYALLVKPGVGIYRSSDHPVWEYIQVKGRLRSNLALVDRNDVRSMLKALMQGNPIWYAPDQDYGTRSSIFVPFFAVQKASTVTGTRDLARVKGTIVQPSFTIRDDKGYRLHIQDPLQDFPGTDEYQDTARINKVIEDMIKLAPEQYLWMHRRFKTTPQGEENRYPKLT